MFLTREGVRATGGHSTLKNKPENIPYITITYL